MSRLSDAVNRMVDKHEGITDAPRNPHDPAQQHTPLPWWIRNHPHDPDKFIVVAKPTPDHPYYRSSTTVDILGDEDYPRKRADAELVVRAANSYAKLLEVLESVAEHRKIGNGHIPSYVFEQVDKVIADAKTLTTAPEPKANAGS